MQASVWRSVQPPVVSTIFSVFFLEVPGTGLFALVCTARRAPRFCWYTHRAVTMDRLKSFANKVKSQADESFNLTKGGDTTGQSSLNSPGVPASSTTIDANDSDEVKRLKTEKLALEKQFQGLVEDFTRMNVSCNEYKGKVYDLEKTQKLYKGQVQQLEAQVNAAETELRKKNQAIKKSQEKGALEKLMEENNDQREQILALKNSIRGLHESAAATTEDIVEEEGAIVDDTVVRTIEDNEDPLGLLGEKGETNTNERTRSSEADADAPSPKRLVAARPKKIERRPSVSDQMAVRQQEELINLNKQVDELKVKLENEKKSHNEDLQSMLEKITVKEEELQRVKTDMAAEKGKLGSSQGKLLEMGKKLEMMVTAYQTVKVTGEASTKKIAELEKEKQKLAAAASSLSSKEVKEMEKKHAEALQKLELESKGALDGARARREAEVQGFQDRLAKAQKKAEAAEKDAQEANNRAAELQIEREKALAKSNETSDLLALTKTELQAQRVRATEAEVKITELQENISHHKLHIEQVKTTLSEETESRMAHEAKLDEARKEIEGHKEAHAEVHQKLTDQSLEHKIAGKRQVQMIKDLKSMLKRETKARELLEEKLKSTTSVLGRLQEEMATPHLTPVKPPAPATRVSSAPTAPSSDRRHSVGAAPVDVDGVKKALAQRLESLLEENVMIKEKVSMLEGIVQDLTVELNIARASGGARNDPTEAGREDNTGTLVPPGEDGAGIDPTDSNVMESFDI